jgi:hypothetical protein
MSEELELQDTPEVDVDAQQDPEAEGQTDPELAKPEEPYLAVNDRTVYKTKDDAIRGYSEAANRIAQLSGWEKQAKAYGLNDPRQLDAVAKELLELRQKVADAAKQVSQPKQSDQADPKAKETAQTIKWLRDQGFISKEEQEASLKELRDQIEEFKQWNSRSEEARFQNQEAEARNDLNGYLSAAGVKDDANGSKAMVIGTLVKDWINNSEERVEQWSRGGIHAKNLVKEGTDYAINMLGWKAAPAAPGALKPTDPGYAAAKAKAVATNKKLPAPGTGRTHGDGSKPKVQKGHINAALHDKAWEIFSKGE